MFENDLRVILENIQKNDLTVEQALERLRQQEIALADAASKQAVTAIGDLGEVLTPEQRSELVAFVHRFHGEAEAR